jgi:hypothetical protein
MANPGYPMQPMQPMQPMGGGMPMQQPGQRPMVRRGTSKAVPVVVSAGLAIGVFAGLSAGLGFDSDESSASTSASTTTTEPKKDEAEVPEPFQPKRNDVKLPPAEGSAKPTEGSAAVAKPAEGSGSAKAEGSGSAVAATGSGSGSAGTGAGSAVTVPSSKIMGKLTVVVKPESAAKVAKIYIDGKQIDGNVFELDLTELLDKTKNEARKNVTVKVRIVGVPSAETKTSYDVELAKIPPGTGIQRPPNPGGGTPPKPKCKKPPCGLIDI